MSEWADDDDDAVWGIAPHWNMFMWVISYLLFFTRYEMMTRAHNSRVGLVCSLFFQLWFGVSDKYHTFSATNIML